MFPLKYVRTIAPLLIVLSLVLSFLPRQTAMGQTSTVQTPYIGMWISAQELSALPTSGTAWSKLVSAADASPGVPDIQNQDSNNDVYVLAKALVYARTGNTRYRGEVVSQLKLAVGTEADGRTLALARNLVSYVIAADLVNLPAADPAFDQTFRTWLRKTLTETLDGKTLVSTHEDRPNNWGTHAGASRAAVALYLKDQTELNRTATVFRGLVGERAVYSGFSYGDLSWQCDASKPLGVNPKGCTKNGYSVDGALPEEMRRGGAFQMPPAETGYPWEALQGITVQAMLLHRAGYPAFEWSDRAVLRAVQYLYHTINWPATGDDLWQVWLINSVYGTSYATTSPAGYGKNMGWTDWTHANRTLTSAPTAAPQPTVTLKATQAPTIQALPTQQPTATQPVAAAPTATALPTQQPTATTPPLPAASPTAVSSGGSIQSITFENGRLVDDANGVDKAVGSVALSSGGEMYGKYSVNIPSVNDSYLQESFSGQNDLYVSMYIKINALPSSASRFLQISNSSTTVGNLVLNTDGSLKLRVGSSTVGSGSQRLSVNTLYRVVLHQKRGSGKDAVLEAFVAPVGQALGAPFAQTTSGTWTTQATFIRFGATMSAAMNARFDDIVISQVMP